MWRAEPIRIRELEIADDARLRRGIDALRRALPRAHEFERIEQALARSIGDEQLEDSGVRHRLPPVAVSEPARPALLDTRQRSRRPAVRMFGMVGPAVAVFAAAALVVMMIRSPAPRAVSTSVNVKTESVPVVPERLREPPIAPAGPEPLAEAVPERRVSPAAPPAVHPVRRHPAVVRAVEADPVPTVTPTVLPAVDQSEQGHVNINSIPITAVVLDGRPIGGTPRVGVTVEAGEHTVLFVHPKWGRKSVRVNVNPGSTVLAAVRFD